MTHTLVIDTSYGSTVGIVGHEPILEIDSRTHVERLQGDIARAVDAAGLRPADLERIVVGVGPAPFTGLRAGIVAAKALAFATGAELIGRDILAPQAQWNYLRHAAMATDGAKEAPHTLTLAVNDARRKQLYFALYDTHGDAEDSATMPVTQPLIGMDIDYPAGIVARINEAVRTWQETHRRPAIVDVVGHGAARYEQELRDIERLGELRGESVLDQGAAGLELFAAGAIAACHGAPAAPVEPLYLRRPDAEVPNPLKHVLGHAGATKA